MAINCTVGRPFFDEKMLAGMKKYYAISYVQTVRLNKNLKNLPSWHCFAVSAGSHIQDNLPLSFAVQVQVREPELHLYFTVSSAWYGAVSKLECDTIPFGYPGRSSAIQTKKKCFQLKK